MLIGVRETWVLLEFLGYIQFISLSLLFWGEYPLFVICGTTIWNKTPKCVGPGRFGASYNSLNRGTSKSLRHTRLWYCQPCAMFLWDGETSTGIACAWQTVGEFVCEFDTHCWRSGPMVTITNSQLHHDDPLATKEPLKDWNVYLPHIVMDNGFLHGEASLWRYPFVYSTEGAIIFPDQTGHY